MFCVWGIAMASAQISTLTTRLLPPSAAGAAAAGLGPGADDTPGFPFATAYQMSIDWILLITMCMSLTLLVVFAAALLCVDGDDDIVTPLSAATRDLVWQDPCLCSQWWLNLKHVRIPPHSMQSILQVFFLELLQSANAQSPTPLLGYLGLVRPLVKVARVAWCCSGRSDSSSSGLLLLPPFVLLKIMNHNATYIFFKHRKAHGSF